MTPDGYREIILIRKLLYAPGDQNVSGYRIPAMDLLPNGDIITAIDQRFIGEDDLPTQINLSSLRSEDGGYTWKDQAML